MSDKRPTKQLFREWRQGDAEAGQTMAQRFADWYYAIATSRLGEDKGKAPCDRACAAFGEGVVNITEGRELVRWAHGLIQTELGTSGARVLDLDEANAYTGNKRPKALLVEARKTLAAEIELLEMAYGTTGNAEKLDELAEPLGGNPIGILKARYAVKAHMKDCLSVPFEVTPDQPVLDRAPLPLYESGRMASEAEEQSFEEWMLSDIDLCRDIAEFAHFSIALRGGLPSDAEAQAQAAIDSKTQSSKSGGAALGVAAITGFAVIGIVLLVAVIGLVVFFAMG
jgi:hypothetical protein